MRHGYINQYASVYSSSHGVRIYDQATEDTLKAEFRSNFRYKCWTSYVLLLHNSLDYLTFTWWLMKITKSWLFLIDSQGKDEPTRDRPINREPTNGDRSLQLFFLHILPLCNVQCMATLEYLCFPNNAGLRFLNNSRLKNLARVSLNANCFMFTSGCLLLFTFSYTFMAQKFYFTILQWIQETLFIHCANVSYMYHCLLLSTEVSNMHYEGLCKEFTGKDLFASKDEPFF